jgi:hypothetical protein
VAIAAAAVWAGKKWKKPALAAGVVGSMAGMAISDQLRSGLTVLGVTMSTSPLRQVAAGGAPAATGGAGVSAVTRSLRAVASVDPGMGGTNLNPAYARAYSGVQRR